VLLLRVRAGYVGEYPGGQGVLACTRGSRWAARSRHRFRPSARVPGSQLILLALMTESKQSPIALDVRCGSSTAGNAHEHQCIPGGRLGEIMIIPEVARLYPLAVQDEECMPEVALAARDGLALPITVGPWAPAEPQPEGDSVVRLGMIDQAARIRMRPSYPAVHNRVVKIRAGNLPVVEGHCCL